MHPCKPHVRSYGSREIEIALAEGIGKAWSRGSAVSCERKGRMTQSDSLLTLDVAPHFWRGLRAQDKNPSYADANLQPSGHMACLHKHAHVSRPHHEGKPGPRDRRWPSHPRFVHTKDQGATALLHIWAPGKEQGCNVEGHG